MDTVNQNQKKAHMSFPSITGSIPPPRWGHSSIYFDKKLYIYGGCYGGQHFCHTLVFDLESCKWDCLITNGLHPGPRDSHGSTLIDHSMYIFGGNDGISQRNDVHVLNLINLVWSELQTSGSKPSPRESHSFTRVENDKLVVFGGSNEGKYLNELHILELSSMTWILPVMQGDIPVSRDSHSAVAVGNRLVVFGGYSGDMYLNDLNVFEFDNSAWKRISMHGKNVPGSRAGHSATNIQNKMFIFGGVGDQVYYNDLWMIDLKNLDSNSTWVSIKFEGSFPLPRFSHTADSADNSLVIYGGCGKEEHALNEILIINLNEALNEIDFLEDVSLFKQENTSKKDEGRVNDQTDDNEDLKDAFHENEKDLLLNEMNPFTLNSPPCEYPCKETNLKNEMEWKESIDCLRRLPSSSSLQGSVVSNSSDLNSNEKILSKRERIVSPPLLAENWMNLAEDVGVVHRSITVDESQSSQNSVDSGKRLKPNLQAWNTEPIRTEADIFLQPNLMPCAGSSMYTRHQATTSRNISQDAFNNEPTPNLMPHEPVSEPNSQTDSQKSLKNLSHFIRMQQLKLQSKRKESQTQSQNQNQSQRQSRASVQRQIHNLNPNLPSQMNSHAQSQSPTALHSQLMHSQRGPNKYTKWSNTNTNININSNDNSISSNLNNSFYINSSPYISKQRIVSSVIVAGPALAKGTELLVTVDDIVDSNYMISANIKGQIFHGVIFSPFSANLSSLPHNSQFLEGKIVQEKQSRVVNSSRANSFQNFSKNDSFIFNFTPNIEKHSSSPPVIVTRGPATLNTVSMQPSHVNHSVPSMANLGSSFGIVRPCVNEVRTRGAENNNSESELLLHAMHAMYGLNDRENNVNGNGYGNGEDKRTQK